MTSWQTQEAKARFSELLDAAINEGPQIITRRGIETVVIVPIDEWRRLKESSKPALKDLLLAPEPKFDVKIPKRGKWRSRTPLEFD